MFTTNRNKGQRLPSDLEMEMSGNQSIPSTQSIEAGIDDSRAKASHDRVDVNAMSARPTAREPPRNWLCGVHRLSLALGYLNSIVPVDPRAVLPIIHLRDLESPIEASRHRQERNPIPPSRPRFFLDCSLITGEHAGWSHPVTLRCRPLDVWRSLGRNTSDRHQFHCSPYSTNDGSD